MSSQWSWASCMPARDDDHHLGWILARGPIVTGPCIKNVNFYCGRRPGRRLSIMSLRINMDTTTIHLQDFFIASYSVHHCSNQSIYLPKGRASEAEGRRLTERSVAIFSFNLCCLFIFVCYLFWLAAACLHLSDVCLHLSTACLHLSAVCLHQLFVCLLWGYSMFYLSAVCLYLPAVGFHL